MVRHDADGGPEVCLGGVAESFPPQRSGPALPGWDCPDWADHEGNFETSGEVRRDEFALTGAWDGEALTVTRGARR